MQFTRFQWWIALGSACWPCGREPSGIGGDLESKTAEEWLIRLGGERVYRVVWQPLLEGKFGPFAADVSAVWFWNKLKLRGGR